MNPPLPEAAKPRLLAFNNCLGASNLNGNWKDDVNKEQELKKEKVSVLVCVLLYSACELTRIHCCLLILLQKRRHLTAPMTKRMVTAARTSNTTKTK